jgi:hypothetical protein
MPDPGTERTRPPPVWVRDEHRTIAGDGVLFGANTQIDCARPRHAIKQSPGAEWAAKADELKSAAEPPTSEYIPPTGILGVLLRDPTALLNIAGEGDMKWRNVM